MAETITMPQAKSEQPDAKSVIDVENPASGEVIASVPVTTPGPW